MLLSVVLIGLAMLLALLWACNKGQSATAMITANKQVPWYLAGSSMSATALSSDTPIIVTGLVYSYGLSGNWLWWIGAPAILATTFFFTNYWYKSGVKTEIELLQLRYGENPSTRFIRALKAIFEGGVLNILLLASITFAFSSVLQEILLHHPASYIQNLSPYSINLLVACIYFSVVTYTSITGLKGVIVTDLFQLIFAIGMSWLILYFLYDHYSITKLINSLPNDKKSLFINENPQENSVYFWLFLILAWLYRAAGSGPLVQRIIACKSANDAKKALLLHSIIHFLLRSWPWLIIGSSAIAILPSGYTAEHAYAAMVHQLLPTELLNLFIVCLIAAYISTLDSHLNWGASLLTNDLLVNPKRSSYISFVMLSSSLGFVIFLADIIDSLFFVYQLSMVIFAGIAPLAITRWYWWKLTIKAETIGYFAAIFLGSIYYWVLPNDNAFWFTLPMLSNAFTVILIIRLFANKNVAPDIITTTFFQKIDSPLAQTSINKFTVNKQPIYYALLCWLVSITIIFIAVLGSNWLFLS